MGRVTPAMIEAGLGAYYESDSRFDLDDETVTRIYIAMESAKRPEGTFDRKAYMREYMRKRRAKERGQ